MAVLSGKGGVGKTVTALNLGVALRDLGRDVIVVDGNITSPHIGLMLGKPRSRVDLHDVLAGRTSIDNAIYVHPSGIRVVPGSISVRASNSVPLDTLAASIMELAQRGEIIIIDGPPGLDQTALTIMHCADQVLAVANPDILSVTDAMRILKVAEQHGIGSREAVVTRSAEHPGHLDRASMESMLGRRLLGIIPEDIAVRHSLKARHPVVRTHPESLAAVAYRRLAARLHGQHAAGYPGIDVTKRM